MALQTHAAASEAIDSDAAMIRVPALQEFEVSAEIPRAELKDLKVGLDSRRAKVRPKILPSDLTIVVRISVMEDLPELLCSVLALLLRNCNHVIQILVGHLQCLVHDGASDDVQKDEQDEANDATKIATARFAPAPFNASVNWRQSTPPETAWKSESSVSGRPPKPRTVPLSLSSFKELAISPSK